MQDKIILPGELEKMLEGFDASMNTVGCSSSAVYEYKKGDTVCYLKISSDIELFREYNIIRWLQDKLPVPKALYFGKNEDTQFLLMSKVNGKMAFEVPPAADKEEHYENCVRLLADALIMLQEIDISECPFDSSIQNKLARALYNIENNIVDMEDFANNDFESPMHLYHYLCDNKIPEELCFTHGDFCLPNIFFENDSVSGFIDLGRGGAADKWQDIALCVRSLKYNMGDTPSEKYVDLLFSYLGIEPNWDKINYYILLDELY